jgi:hypothetical protein
MVTQEVRQRELVILSPAERGTKNLFFSISSEILHFVQDNT